MPRPALTILAVYAHKIARADFGRGAPPPLLELWEEPRPEVDDIGILVEAAIMQGPKLRGRVWILWSDLFAQTVRLDAKSMGLHGKDLQTALAFEAEALSGIGGLESLVAYRQVAVDRGEREFWVVQARQADAELLRDIVGRHGGRLAGITTPASLEIPAAASADAANDPAFRAWLDACAAHLADKRNKPEAIKPPGVPLTARQRWLAAFAVALPVVAFCFFHRHYVVEPAIAKMKSETKIYQGETEKFKGMDKQIAELTKQKDELIKKNKTVKETTAVLETQRTRVAALLTQLSQHRDQDLVILKIDSPGGEPTIHGLCLQPDVATVFARKIGAAALALGYQAQSPKSEAQNLLPNGGPWTFELHFKDVLANEPTGAAPGNPRRQP